MTCYQWHVYSRTARFSCKPNTSKKSLYSIHSFSKKKKLVSENHQPRQVPTLSQHDHTHLNSNHAHLVPPNQDLHITTITCHSPLSGLDRHNLRTPLSLLVPVIVRQLGFPFRTPTRELQPVVFSQISPSHCSMPTCRCCSAISFSGSNKYHLVNLILLVWSPSVVWHLCVLL